MDGAGEDQGDDVGQPPADDLAVGAPLDHFVFDGEAFQIGSVMVVFGSPGGLWAAADPLAGEPADARYFYGGGAPDGGTLSFPPVGDVDASGNYLAAFYDDYRFGYRAAIGIFDGDGFPDLAVGMPRLVRPREDLSTGSGLQERAGGVLWIDFDPSVMVPDPPDYNGGIITPGP